MRSELKRAEQGSTGLTSAHLFESALLMAIREPTFSLSCVRLGHRLTIGRINFFSTSLLETSIKLNKVPVRHKKGKYFLLFRLLCQLVRHEHTGPFFENSK
jgi:hypothetical protein